MARRNEEFSHLSRDGKARMVDVSDKAVSSRKATAEAWVNVGMEIAAKLRHSGGLTKGNVMETARLAGIFAAKQTPNLIPMCHPLLLDDVKLDAQLIEDQVRITATVCCQGKTGVEIEAMTAAAVAALTVYDMVKSAGRGVQIGPVRLLEKSGGKSGHFSRDTRNGKD